MADNSMDKAVSEGWASLPADNPQPTDGYGIHPGKYWRSRLCGGGAANGGHVADGGTHGGGVTRG